jgi:hypothetical protein
MQLQTRVGIVGSVLFSFSVVLLFVLSLTATVGAVNLLPAGDFEDPSMLRDWVGGGNSRFGTALEIVDQAYEGKGALLVKDLSPTEAHGLRSPRIAVVEGHEYRARAKATNLGAIYLEFWDEKGIRIFNIRNRALPGPAWNDLELMASAPKGAVSATVYCYFTVNLDVYKGEALFDNVELVDLTANPEVLLDVEGEMVSSSMQLDYQPADGSSAPTNPASFVWVPVSGATSYQLQVSSSPDFASHSTQTYNDIDLSIFTPPIVMDTEPTYYWRVRGVSKTEIDLPWSDVRSFRYAQSAVEMPLPALTEVRSQIPNSHPRLFVTAETLADWQAKLTTDPLLQVLWKLVLASANTDAFMPLPSEPPNCRIGGVFNSNVWSQANSITNQAIDIMERLAFTYLVTGDSQIGQAARRWILHIASWDPKGSTGAAINDESSRPLLLKLARAYTWAYNTLSPEDREFVRQVVQIRGTEAYRIVKGRPYESKPWDSHATGSLPIIGEVALAFLGEIPEAEEWFDYIVRIMHAVYPIWGGYDGGWSEGHAYWNTGMDRAFCFMDALRVVTGLDLYRLPFFQRTGDFKLLTHPPYSKIGPFGDHSDTAPNSTSGESMAHLAAVFQNPYYQWYAKAVGTPLEMGVMGLIRAYLYDRTDLEGIAPINLPSSAHFRGIGWVVFHRDYHAPQDERIQFMFKSSPYGSFSHSYADQNSFTLEAYGEPLAISSGYRPWYSSAHHLGWTKTTQAHNAILVNGQGQQTQSLAAKGEIIGYLGGQSFSYTAGNAQVAYGSNLLDKYVRHVVYLRPDLFVIYDDLKAPKESNFSWLFHAYHKSDIEPSGQGFQLSASQADLQVRLWSNSSLTYSQTNQFAVPLDKPLNKPVQWHLTATNTIPIKEAYFLSLLQPLHKGEASTIDAEPITVAAGEGIKISNNQQHSIVLFRRFSGDLIYEGVTANGDVAAWRDQQDGKRSALLVNGVSWLHESGFNFSTTIPVNVEFNILDKEITGLLCANAGSSNDPFTLTLQVPTGRIVNVTSTNEIDFWQAEGNILTMNLYPGEHEIVISLD